MKYTRKQRQAFIISWKSSGLSKAQFCRKRGLSAKNFYTWFEQLGFKQASADINTQPKPLAKNYFSKVVLEPTPPSVVKLPKCLTLHLPGDISLTFEDTIDLVTLKALIKELKTCN